VLDDSFAHRLAQFFVDQANLSGRRLTILDVNRLARFLDQGPEFRFGLDVPRSSLDALPMSFDDGWMNSQRNLPKIVALFLASRFGTVNAAQESLLIS
jgi:hypothetical protein